MISGCTVSFEASVYELESLKRTIYKYREVSLPFPLDIVRFKVSNPRLGRFSSFPLMMTVANSWLIAGAFSTILLPYGHCHAAKRGVPHQYCNGNVTTGYNVAAVAQQARMLASHSWEYGTAAEAFLELYNPELSVFSDDPFPGNKIPVTDWQCVNALAYVQPFILTENQTLIDGDGKLTSILQLLSLHNY